MRDWISWVAVLVLLPVLLFAMLIVAVVGLATDNDEPEWIEVEYREIVDPQIEFELEAVGQDWDGTFKPIDQLR